MLYAGAQKNVGCAGVTIVISKPSHPLRHPCHPIKTSMVVVLAVGDCLALLRINLSQLHLCASSDVFIALGPYSATVRDDLLGKARKETPSVLDYTVSGHPSTAYHCVVQPIIV